ncbi:MAG: wax ester/triacylglycerol synthase family O-acyltransferase [Salinisphaeraceae bacterium]|nr:wax ester/triacylglycerol synthase family O-acyltransferase [Salinisphaeraceae bacterium]
MQPEFHSKNSPAQRLNGADSFFLNIESDECPMNMGLLLLLEAGDEQALLQRIREVVSKDTDLCRKLRCRLQTTPMKLGHPSWVPDTDFDLDEHIIRHDLSTSDDPDALQRLIEKIDSTRLPLDKPLWQVHIIKQVPGNQTAIIVKMHHSLADGVTGMQLWLGLMDHSAAKKQAATDNKTVSAKAQEQQGLLDNKFQQWLQLPAQLLQALFSEAALCLYVVYLSFLKRPILSASTNAPATRFNRPINARRSYAYGTLRLAEFREIDSAFACTRNETFLAIVAGTLRAYLSENHELPPTSLYAGLPLTLSQTEQRGRADNQLAFYRSSLATRVEDPEQRLKQIQRRLARNTRRVRSEWRKRLLERLINLPPRTTRKIAQLYRYLLSWRLLAPNVNLFATLLPGPSTKASICGRAVKGIYPISIPYHGVGLAITAIRYHDKLFYGIIADREQLPNPERLANLMRATTDDLLARARTKNNQTGSAAQQSQ